MNELTLIKNAMKGGSESFSFLVEQYYARVLFHALKRLGNRWSAEEIAQETFLKVFISIRHLDNPTSFGAWLFSICNNEINTYFRKKIKAEKADEGHKIGITGNIVCSDAPAPGQTKLLTAIEGLELPQKEVILLKYFAHLSMNEISVLTGVPAGRIKSRLYEARRNLEKLLHNNDINIQLINRKTYLKWRNGIMEKIKMIETGAYIIPRMSLAAQVNLLENALENKKFPEEVISEMANIKKSSEFIIECNGQLSSKELVTILAYCDNTTVSRLNDGTNELQKVYGFNLLSEVNEHIGVEYSLEKLDACLFTTSIEEIQEWYRHVLGFNGGVEVKDEKGRGTYGCMYMGEIDGILKGSRNSIGLNFGLAESQGSEGIGLWFTVKCIDSLRTRIISKGWDKISEIRQEEWGARTLHVIDPKGTRIMFMESVVAR